MNNIFSTLTFSILLLNPFSAMANQGLSPDGPLTPLGAEKAGNGNDIPAWDGGLPRSLEGLESGFHVDPYSSDKPVYRITSRNMEIYDARLSGAQKALLEKYPSFYMNVYPSRRSASYPDYVYSALRHNLEEATLLPFGSGVKGTVMTSPFPVPETGLEVLWNHSLRFKGHSAAYSALHTVVSEVGSRMDKLIEYKAYFKYSEKGLAAENVDNKMFMLIRKTLKPANQSGRAILIHETIDRISSPRKSWLYVPGQRRLRRTPNLAYDAPDPNMLAFRTIDQVDMFNGAPDYYDWKLLGKQEMYIPYNSYRVHQGSLKVDDILQDAHINPSLLRYEPHRVWVIEANLRVGYKHKYTKRRYYLDEDSWSIVYAEDYDSDGELVQISEAHLVNFYEVPLVYSTLEVTYDLKTGEYYAEGLDNEQERTINFLDTGLKEKEFSINAVRMNMIR